MSDNHEHETGGDFAEAAGEWAVIAMACIAYADGHADASEIENARRLMSTTSIIKNSMGPEFGEQLFMDTIARIRNAPETELTFVKDQLRDLARRVTVQEHRDLAFQTLLHIATANGEIDISEFELMQELREMIGSSLLVPPPSRSC